MNIEIKTQKQFYDIVTVYNRMFKTDRKTIKTNLKRCKKEYGFSNEDIIKLGHEKRKVDPWMNMASNNIPMFEDALHVAVSFNFPITELYKPLEG